MATKTVITGYGDVTHILPAEMLDLDKLAEAGGSVVEEFEVEVQRGTKEKPKTETDYLVKIAVPADKIAQFGGIATTYDSQTKSWAHSQIKKEDHAITEEVDEPDPIETFGLDESDPLFATKLQILKAEKAAAEAKEAEQRAAQEAAAAAAREAEAAALTAKAIEVKKLLAKGKSVEVALATLAAKPGL